MASTHLLGVTGRQAAVGQIRFFANPRLGRGEEFVALCAHIVEDGFYNGDTALDAGYRIPP